MQRRGLLEAWIRSSPELPTPPAIALQVIERTSDPECTLNELVEIISGDPALCAKVLRTVNSAMYGLRHPVCSIPSAVRILGIHPLRSLVLAFSMAGVRWTPLPREALRTYWRVSIAGTIVARQLAGKLRRPSPDNDLVAGLLRDVGVLVLHQLFPVEYRNILSHSPEVLSAFQCMLEEETLHVDHAAVSAELLRSWRLPDEITEPVRCHHDLTRVESLAGDLRERGRLLYFASQIGQMQHTPNRPLLVREVRKLAKELFGMDEQSLLGFLDSVQNQMNGFAATIEVDIGAGYDFSEILNRGAEAFARISSDSKDPAAKAETPANHAPAGAKSAYVDEDTARVVAQEALLDRLFSAPRMENSLGTIDGYEVKELIGWGGMGAVFRANDPRLGCSVAIKTLHPDRLECSRSRMLFLQEAQSIATLTHQNIVRVYGVGEAVGVPFLVMEDVKGISLRDRLMREAPLPLQEIIRVGLDVASGLSAAHAHGLIHRDIKPANLLIEEGSGRVKIVDFGLVLARGNDGTGEGLTGTPHFMSPEQASGKPLTMSSDMFSLGSVLYATSTGVLPFNCESVGGVLRQLRHDTPALVRSLNPELPVWLEEIIAGLLTKDPTSRYPTATELRSLLLSQWAKLVTGRRSGVLPRPKIPS